MRLFARTLLAVVVCGVLAAAADVTGSWKFEVTIDGAATGTPTMLFKQSGEKLEGTYSGFFGELKLSGTVKGEVIEFVIQAEREGQKIPISYAGKIEAATAMAGKVTFGELGQGTWKATKQ